jgi:hypothetical protein
MVVTGDRMLLGDRVVRGSLLVAGWGVTAVLAVLNIVYLGQQITGGGG